MFRVLVVFVVLLGSASQSVALDFKSMALGILAMHRRPTPAPPVVPMPTPSGVCENCDGKGKVGDGTVFVTCPVCDGSGKTKTEVKPVEAPKVKDACADGACEPPRRRGLFGRLLP